MTPLRSNSINDMDHQGSTYQSLMKNQSTAVSQLSICGVKHLRKELPSCSFTQDIMTGEKEAFIHFTLFCLSRPSRNYIHGRE